jgi:hypothetical protein
MVLIVGCGRTGTNMLLEMLRGSSFLHATAVTEHKTVFKNCPELPSEYLSKCDTVYIPNLKKVDDLILKNRNVKILFTIRDFRDCVLSKIYRGQPGQDGNIELADDATPDGCVMDIRWADKIYEYIKFKYPQNIMLVKMEDVILNTEKTLSNVCDFCNIPYEKVKMLKFTSRYRNQDKSSRYKSLDKSQVGLHTRIKEIYDGFYRDFAENIYPIYQHLGDLLFKHGYVTQDEFEKDYGNFIVGRKK